MAGAIFPDKVEGKPGANYWSWRARHRGWSHWPVLYIAILAIMQMGLLPQGADVERGATFICIGALLHIAEDALCGKVPLFLPWQKVGIKLFTVGSVTEYLFSMAVVILTYIIHAQVMVK
jgi:inner membrane protein